MDTILGIALAALLGCLVLACLHVFVRRGNQRARAADERQAALEKTVGDMRTTLAQMREELSETRGQVGLLEPPPPARSGMNITVRTAALRLHRTGRNQSEIAETLRVPEQEVKLLLKVHQLCLRRVEAARELEKTA